MPAVIGEGARPGIVACGFGPDHAFAKVVDQYSGRVHYLSSHAEIRWQSWDAAVVLEGGTTSGNHLRVLQIGGQPPGTKKIANNFQKVVIRHERPGHELVVPEGLPPDLEELVRRELVPAVAAVDDRPAFKRRCKPAVSVDPDDPWYTPLLEDLDGYAFAASYKPPHGLYHCIYLPEVITDIRPWLLCAFRMWSEELPEAFPSEPEWTQNSAWMTTPELHAAARLEAEREEAQRLIDEANASIQSAENSLREAQEAADSSARLLLTGTDEPLVEMVMSTLKLFGFDVTDVDASIAAGHAKKEDLRVSDGDWTAICEVKGYSRGGKLGDIGKLQGYATLYAAEKGAPPAAMWYVVNQWRGTDPSNRALILQGGDDYLEVFAEQSGLVIDTRSLFTLRNAVEAGRMPAPTARDLLKSSTGRFSVEIPN